MLLDEIIQFYIDQKAGVVPGLLYTATAVELSDHAKSRANHHRDKADLYARQAESLRGERNEMPRPSGKAYSNSSTNDPVETLEESARYHRNKSSYFSWISTHFQEGKQYRLTETDLATLELKR